MADAPPLTSAEQVVAAGLDPLLLPRMLRHRERVLAAGIPFRLISGRRSSSQQVQLNTERQAAYDAWVQGGKRGPEPRPAAGVSKHEYGMAYDFAGPQSDADFARAGQLAESLGLESGHRYARKDNGHVEVPDSLAAVQSLTTLRLAAVSAVLGLAWLAFVK